MRIHRLHVLLGCLSLLLAVFAISTWSLPRDLSESNTLSLLSGIALADGVPEHTAGDSESTSSYAAATPTPVLPVTPEGHLAAYPPPATEVPRPPGSPQVPVWTEIGRKDEGYLGQGVDTGGDVNGDGYDEIIVGDSATARVYGGSLTGLGPEAAWVIPDCGEYVATAGDVNGDGYADVICGRGPNFRPDKVYVYYGGPAGLRVGQADWAVVAPQAYVDPFGEALGTAGDVNGDGYDDVIISGISQWMYGYGRAYLYLGSPSGLLPSPSWIAYGNTWTSWFGGHVGTAGDVNGDGYDDVIIGSPGDTSSRGASDAGKVFLFLGAAGGLTRLPGMILEGTYPGDAVGETADAAGDVNADGYADVIISYRSRPRVYLGSSTGLSTDFVELAVQGTATGGRAAGDINGDGYGDVIVGGRSPTEGEIVYIFWGSSWGLNTTARWFAESEQRDCGFGSTVGAAGDVNGDESADVVVGSLNYDSGGGLDDYQGRVDVYSGGLGSLRTVEARSANAFLVPGQPQVITTVYRDELGWQNIRYAELMINDVYTDTTHCPYLRYDVQNDRMFLHHPSMDQWVTVSGETPGSEVTISNVYATLDLGQSAVVTDTNTVTVTWALTLSRRNSGKRTLYLAVEDMQGIRLGWNDHGECIVNRPPNYLIPPDINRQEVSAGERYTFNPRYRDLDGWGNLDQLYFAIADALPTGEMEPNGVFLKYDQGENKLYLADTAGTTWIGDAAPGTVTILENSAVKVIVQWSSPGIYDAKTRIVRWRLESKSEFVGHHKVYMRAIDQFPAAGGDTGWKWKGWIDIR